MSSSQSLKAAMNSRVDTSTAHRLGSQRQNLGEGLMCPAGAGDLQNDVYGRPANHNTLYFGDAACSHYNFWSAQRRIEVENNNRPYLPICAAGLRGAGDPLGTGRDRMPQNMYGDGYQGNFVRHYETADNSPPQRPLSQQTNYYQRQIQPFSFTHDATHHVYRG